MRAVLDTNVIVSSFLSPTGIRALVLALWEKGLFELVVSSAILAEYERVLAYQGVQERHGMSQATIATVVADFRSFAIVVEPDEAIDVIADDPSDNRFLEAAVAGNCEYVVSGDPHLLRLGEFRGIQVVPPATFLMVLQQQP
jgi:putative PIN family toxin of toxin-antitoxin system